MSEMTSKERVYTAINHKEPDMVPITEFVYSRKLYKEVIGIAPEHYDAEAVMRCANKIGYDSAVIPFGGFGGFNENDAQTYEDEWGTTYMKEEDTWPSDAPVGFPIKDKSDLKNYTFPDATLASRTDGINKALKLNKDMNKFVVGSVRGPFSGSWLLTGFEGFCFGMYDDPDFINEIVTKVTDFYITGGLRMIEAGADAIQFADDYGSNAAPFMSLDMFKQMVVPHMKRMVDAFKKAGTHVIMHSDGNLNALLSTIFEQNIDAYHPMERAAGMDIAQIKRDYGDKIMLIGNVNNKTTLVTGTREEIEAEVKECIRIAAPGGGFMLASDHSVHDDIPNENVLALYEAGRKYGNYPINIK